LDPHINLGADLTIPTIEPRVSLGVSVASIGQTTNNNTYRFINPKIEVGKNLAAGIDLVGVNTNQILDIPLVQDTWLWAGGSVNLYPDTGTPVFTVGIGSTL
jgi:hypothetical protein